MTDDELEALLEQLEADLTADVGDALAGVADEFANAVDGATELVAARFSVSRIRDMWRRRVGPIMDRLRGAAQQAAQVTADDLGGEVTPEEVEAQLGDYVEQTQQLLDAVGDRLAEEATAALAEGLNEGEDTDQLKARLIALFTADPEGTQLGEGRAKRIAMTEATRAWNAGTLAAAQALSGPDRPLVKQWITRMDDRVRKAHRAANGQLQLLDEPFDVGGTKMQYPGDPTAPAALTIGCRCIMRASTARATEGSDVTADGSSGEEFQSRMPETLKRYWLAGAGAAKIRWGTPGAFDRCVRSLRDDFPQDPEGLCANLYHEATGKWPGANSGNTSHLSGAMIALIPTRDDAARLALNGGEDADQLHLTLFTLGEGADWSTEDRIRIVRQASVEASRIGPVTGRAFGVAQWNPGGESPWVWNVGDATDVDSHRLDDAYSAALFALDGFEAPAQYRPWSPHICAQYTSDDLMADMCERVGPVTFDRIRVAFAGENYDFPLHDGGYQIGERVMVAGEPHEAGHTAGTVEEISEGPAYGIRFDGTDEIHHWYVGDELMPEKDGPGTDVSMEHDAYLMPQFMTWSTPGDMALAFENQQTGDGRLFAPDALYWEHGPWPLQYADEMNGGHDGAELAGAIADMGREGDRITGHGVLYLTQQAGVEAAMLLSQGAPLGVSVDLDDVSVQMIDATQSAAYDTHMVTASLLPLEDGGFLFTGETATAWTAAGTSLAGESSKVTFHIGADGRIPADAFEVSAAAGDGDVTDGLVLDQQNSGDFLMRIVRARVRGATLVTIPAYSLARLVLDDASLFASAGELTADAASNDYDRVVRHVRKSLTPASAAGVAARLGLPIAQVRRHLAKAAQIGDLVRLTRGNYVKPSATGGPANATASATPATLDVAGVASTSYAELTAAATGAVDLPVYPRDTEWDGDAAADRVFQWADGDTDKISQAFAYRDDDADPATKAAYKLGYADVTDGELWIVPKGVFAAQAALNGARGGTSIPSDQVAAVRSKLDAVRAHVDEMTGGEMRNTMEASAWSAMADLPSMPASWFAEPTEAELPPGGPGVNYKDGRIFGWVAQAGEPHAGYAKKITIDGLGRIDTSHFLRQRFTLDDGSTVKAGAFTMNAGHHRDGAECETAACQFDDTRTVAGIVTVGMSSRGMWFSGAAAPWMSEWDRTVFSGCQPSYHLKKGGNGQWQLRAVLSVPVPGHSSPLLASAVVERSQLALTAAATMVEVEEAVAAATAAAAPAVAPVADIDYDQLADALVASMARAEQRKVEEAAELEALLSEAATMDLDSDATTEGN